jgi:hypothetical protein
MNSKKAGIFFGMIIGFSFRAFCQSQTKPLPNTPTTPTVTRTYTTNPDQLFHHPAPGSTKLQNNPLTSPPDTHAAAKPPTGRQIQPPMRPDSLHPPK